MAEEKFNMRNPAVKRILQEVKDMQNNPSHEYLSMPLEDNIFEWQFAILGPKDSEFEGGIYHGRIQLPSEYPFKPPAFMLLTPNGRFETQTKICLSISQHHPEHWQPSWSVRTALVALIAFMPTKPDGALGSLDYTKEERRALAIKSRIAPKFGNSERQNLIDEIHEQMMRTAPPVPDLAPADPAVLSDGNSQEIDNTNMTDAENAPQVVENVHELHVNANAGPIALSITAGFSLSTRAPAARPEPNPAVAPRVAPHELEAEPTAIRRRQPSDDRGLTLLAIGLTVAIVALLAKKFLKFYGWVDL